MKEIWKPIIGWEGLYSVSNISRIKSHKRMVNRIDPRKNTPYAFIQKERIMSSRTNLKNGYVYIILYRDGKGKGYRVHRLVAKAFIPNPNNYPHINHKDEIKTNNCVNNLEWCDSIYNNNYGTCRKRGAMTNRKPIAQIDKNTLQVINVFNSLKDASEQTGIYKSQISCVCNGKQQQKTAGGFVWKYI